MIFCNTQTLFKAKEIQILGFLKEYNISYSKLKDV